MARDEYTYVNVDEILKATPGALLLLIGDTEEWVPRSQVEDGEDYEEGMYNQRVGIKTWLAKDRGLVE